MRTHRITLIPLDCPYGGLTATVMEVIGIDRVSEPPLAHKTINAVRQQTPAVAAIAIVTAEFGTFRSPSSSKGMLLAALGRGRRPGRPLGG